MPKILFICLGNVARSQMAEAYYNHLTGSHDATSAGALDFTPKKYKKLPDEVISVMKEEGIDVSRQKVKTITKPMAALADRIYVLCKKEECPGFLTQSSKVKFWDIPDPFGKSLDEIRKTRDEIKKKV
ncbi:MAG: hypothetical protein V1743_04605, partial [Nanoarchaeota archaeon]